MVELTFGYETRDNSDIKGVLSSLRQSGLQFVAIPLFHPRLRRDNINVSMERLGPGTRSDREVSCANWAVNMVGKISEWIDCDSEKDHLRIASERALSEEFGWAIHLGLQAVMLPTPSLSCPNYARCVAQLAAQASIYQQMWIRIPLTTPFTSKNIRGDAGEQKRGYSCNQDGWLLWNKFRFLANHNHRIGVALEFTEDIFSAAGSSSSNSDSDSAHGSADNTSNADADADAAGDYSGNASINMIRRWCGENVKAIVLHTRIFYRNKKGFPVLDKPMQYAISLLLKQKMQVIFKGRAHHEQKYLPYTQYIDHLRSKYSPHETDDERFCAAYKDTLQSPLQPLTDNLESQTYEVFERDPVKYARYQDAVEAALRELGQGSGVVNSPYQNKSIWSAYGSSTGGAGVVITVVGAGRGPLVSSCLAAAATLGVRAHVYAVEKNRNAVITLRNRCLTDAAWKGCVTVVSGDMRSWEPPELADIMVSELLGSLGDNELSPECLDGAQNCLKPNGVSIPQEYTSFLAPVTASKLWMCARDILDGNGLDTPYVVKMHCHYQLARSQPLFTFKHPNFVPKELIDNARFASLTFGPAAAHSVVHGFAGFFEARLYGDIVLSTNPQTFSQGMFSWFPLFIPLASPVTVSAGTSVTLSVWRCVSDRQVWYEWCVSDPVCTAVQNTNGKSYWIGR